MNIFSDSLRAILLAALFGAVVTPVLAQPVDSPATDRAVVDRVDSDDDGFDWGLLGLLGLLGLIPRKQHVAHDSNRSNPNVR